MNKLQDLLGEANVYLGEQGTQIEMPMIHVGTLYEVSDTTLGMTQTVGRLEELDTDYENRKRGIGVVVPEMSGFSDVLRDVQTAASRIISLQQKHQKTMDAMTWLCFNHIFYKFGWKEAGSRGGLFRIKITAQKAVFQILFSVGHGMYFPAHEIDLSDIARGNALRKHPFSQIPPEIMIPSSYNSGEYIPVTFEAWTALLDSMPLNEKKHTMYRSHTADVFGDFKILAKELLAA